MLLKHQKCQVSFTYAVLLFEATTTSLGSFPTWSDIEINYASFTYEHSPSTAEKRSVY